ncbi:MAG: preprotein translocase subunit SecG [Clostridia bacterium]|nr:preprotein translocase subunit SecG [Clostridia bacterium]
MTAIDYVLGGILLAAALFLVVAVLMQSGKSHGLSGSIAGGAETFFGKTKGKTMDKVFSKLTTIIAIIFVIIVIVVYVMQPNATTEAVSGDTEAEVEEVEGGIETDALETVETTETVDDSETVETVETVETEAPVVE